MTFLPPCQKAKNWIFGPVQHSNIANSELWCVNIKAGSGSEKKKLITKKKTINNVGCC